MSTPSWYVAFQAVLGLAQFAIAAAMLVGYRRSGVWGLSERTAQAFATQAAVIGELGTAIAEQARVIGALTALLAELEANSTGIAQLLQAGVPRRAGQPGGVVGASW